MLFCYFMQIPKEIGLLHSLSCFDVSHNKELRHLPYEMGNLEFLFMVCQLTPAAVNNKSHEWDMPVMITSTVFVLVFF